VQEHGRGTRRRKKERKKEGEIDFLIAIGNITSKMITILQNNPKMTS